MRKIFAPLLLALFLCITGADVALAEDYTVTITVDGKPITITISTANDGIDVTSDTDGVEIGAIKEADSPAPQTAKYRVGRNANLRSGPGTSFAVAGSVRVGDIVTVVATNDAGDWHQLDTGNWIAAFLVEKQVTSTPTAKPRAAAIATPVPSPTLAKPTNTPTAVNSSSDGYRSGGLGLSQSDWEKNHTETALDYMTMGTGYDYKYDVMFQAGNVWGIERQWSTSEFASTDEVEAESQTLIPTDSQFIETYSPDGRPETIVNLYFSESLKSRFKDGDSLFGSWWAGGEPGNFIVLYNVYDGEVGRMIIAIGNNP